MVDKSGVPSASTGTTKFFKGFGYIMPDDGGDDVFVDVSEVPGKQPLHEDMRVGYDDVQSAGMTR